MKQPYEIYINDEPQPRKVNLNPALSLYDQLKEEIEVPPVEQLRFGRKDDPTSQQPLSAKLPVRDILGPGESAIYLYRVKGQIIDPPPFWKRLLLVGVPGLLIISSVFLLLNPQLIQRIIGGATTAATEVPTAAEAAPGTADAPTATEAPTVTATGPNPTLRPLQTGEDQFTNQLVDISQPPHANDPRYAEIAIISPLNVDRVDAFVRVGLFYGGEMALAMHQDDLTAPGLTYRLQKYSDNADDAQAGLVADHIVQNENILCVVGHYTSNASITARGTYQEKDLASISPSNTYSEVIQQEGTNWRLAGTDIGRGHATARFIGKTLNHRRVFVIYDVGRANYEEAATSFKQFSTDYDVMVEDTWFKSFNYGDEDSTKPVIEALEAAMISSEPPQAVYLAADTEFSIKLIPAIRAIFRNENGPIIGADGMDSWRFAEAIQQQLQDAGDIYSVTVALPPNIPDDMFTTAFEDFVTGRGDQYKRTPPYAAESHDATFMCMRAIQKATADLVQQGIERRPTRSEVLNAMKALTTSQEFKTDARLYAGPYNFDDTRNLRGVYYVRKVAFGQMEKTNWAFRCVTTRCGQGEIIPSST